MRRWMRAIAVVCLSAAASLAQTPAVTLTGVVVDPSGAAIPHAEIDLHSAAGDRHATADGIGRFSVALPPGDYDVTVSVQGFRTYTQQALTVGARNPPLSIKLEIAATEEQVDVSGSNSLSTDSSSNKNAMVFSGDKLDQFSDDPQVMTEQLNALGSVDPTQPPQLYVDGFSGAQMPPKESIREIRINQNPLTAQYDSFGQGRIEIFTKPGANKLHGQIQFGDSNSALNATNPYVLTQPAYNVTYVNGNLNGPIGKNSSYFFNMFRNGNATNAIVKAVDPATGNTLELAVPNPTVQQNYSLRFDHQFGKLDTFIARYTYSEAQATNGGVGQFVLPSEGYNSDTRTQTLQMTDTHLFSAKVVSDTAVQYVRSRGRQDAISSAPTIAVQGAFNAGGSPTQALHDNQDRIEFREELSIAHGSHFVRTGGRFRMTREANLSTTGYNGQFVFPNYTAYQITEQGLAAHETDAQIRATCQTQSDGTLACGGATQLSVTVGQATARILTADFGIYGEDEWKATKDLTLSYGLRLESQTAIPDHFDVGPRVGFAYSWKRNAKAKDPFIVFRGGFGLFYQRFPATNLLQSLRQNGTTQQSYFLVNPSSDVYNPNSMTAPSTTGLSSTPPTIYTVDPHLRMPMQMQGMIDAEHSFGTHGSLSITYYQRRSTHQFDSVNVNAPLPNGTRPMGGTQNVYQYSSEGASNGDTLVINPNINITKTLSFFAAAVIGHQESNSLGGFASNSYNLNADAGRIPIYAPRGLFAGINGTLLKKWDVTGSMFLAWRSDTYFNITTGLDNNGDSIYNDRPSFASAATPANELVKTPYGDFDLTPQPGETIIPYAYGSGPGVVYTDIYLAKNFRFGPRPAPPAPPAGAVPAAAPAPAANGTAAAAKPANAKPAELPPPRYRIQFSIDGNNAFNHVNRGLPVGVLSSPFFGQSTTLSNNFGSSFSSNRAVTLRTAFFF